MSRTPCIQENPTGPIWLDCHGRVYPFMPKTLNMILRIYPNFAEKIHCYKITIEPHTTFRAGHSLTQQLLWSEFRRACNSM